MLLLGLFVVVVAFPPFVLFFIFLVVVAVVIIFGVDPVYSPLTVITIFRFCAPSRYSEPNIIISSSDIVICQ